MITKNFFKEKHQPQSDPDEESDHTEPFEDEGAPDDEIE